MEQQVLKQGEDQQHQQRKVLQGKVLQEHMIFNKQQKLAIRIMKVVTKTLQNGEWTKLDPIILVKGSNWILRAMLSLIR